MSALASLVRAYDRMATRGEIPPYGYSQEKIGFVIPLNPDGSVAHAPIDLRRTEGKEEDGQSHGRAATVKTNLGHRTQLSMGQERICVGRDSR